MEEKTKGLRVSRLFVLNGEGTVKAMCDVAVGNLFVIKGLRVIKGKQGIFVSMPRQQGKDGKWYDSVHPLTKEARAEVGRVVLEAYHREAAVEETI